MGETAYYQDAFVDLDAKVIPIQERAHQFGDGIYEVIRVYGGRPFTMLEHLQRLEKSANAIDLDLPYSSEEIGAICMDGLERSGLKEAELYIQISRGIHARQHYYPDSPCAVFSMTIKHARIIPDEKRVNGVNVLTVEDDRWKNCYIKSLNLLPNVMAKQKAKRNGCEEAIYHEQGIVKEGSASNLFIFKNGTLSTYPALNGIIHGITRQIVMDIAREKDIKVVEETFTVDQLKQADEVFITSSNMEIMPVRKVDEDHLPTNRPIINELIKAYQRKVLE